MNRDSEMRGFTVPEVYTLVAFGMSIFLWLYVPRVPLGPSMDGVLLGFVHPYFTAEFFLMVSTIAVWTVALLIFLSALRSQRVAIVTRIIQNRIAIGLALATLISATFGVIFYLQPYHFDEPIGNAGALPPPNPLLVINGLGIIFCEAGWMIAETAKITKTIHKRREGEPNPPLKQP